MQLRLRQYQVTRYYGVFKLFSYVQWVVALDGVDSSIRSIYAGDSEEEADAAAAKESRFFGLKIEKSNEVLK